MMCQLGRQVACNVSEMPATSSGHTSVVRCTCKGFLVVHSESGFALASIIPSLGQLIAHLEATLSGHAGIFIETESDVELTGE